MSKAKKLKELREMSKDELIKEHDEQAVMTQVGVDYYLNELFRREQQEHNKTIRNCTIAIAIMTLIITISTIVNIFFYPTFKFPQ